MTLLIFYILHINICHQEPTSKSGDSDSSTMPRKLTRSLSARVSRLATVSRPTHTDTDSDDDKRDKRFDNSNLIEALI